MLALILFLILVCVAVGIVGFVVNGLLWLFIIACVLFAITLLAGVMRAGGRRRRVAR